MILWFAGVSFVFVWWVFRSPALDYRLVMLGSILGGLATWFVLVMTQGSVQIQALKVEHLREVTDLRFEALRSNVQAKTNPLNGATQ